MSKDENVYSIPAKHVVETTQVMKYKLREKARVSLVRETTNNDVSYFYFETLENPHVVQKYNYVSFANKSLMQYVK